MMACSTVAIPARAQVWYAGAKGGFGQGGFTGSSEFNWGHISPTWAASFNRAISDRFALQPEIAYLHKQGVSKVGGSELTLNVDYFEIPLLAQYRLLPSGAFVPYLLAGPNFSFSKHCDLKFVGGGLTTFDDCGSGNGTVRTRSIDFGATLGAGIYWPVGVARMSLEGRGSVGARSLVAPVAATNPRSFGWAAMLGFSLPLHVPSVLQPPPAAYPFPTVPSRAGVPISASMPPISAPTIVERPASAPMPASTKRVSVSAVDADAKTLLIAIAKEADMNIVVSSDVRSRVTINMKDVAASDAIAAIMEAAGLSVEASPKGSMLPAVVFYQLPLDVNKASTDAIVARFGVSKELAEFIVASRTNSPRD